MQRNRINYARDRRLHIGQNLVAYSSRSDITPYFAQTWFQQGSQNSEAVSIGGAPASTGDALGDKNDDNEIMYYMLKPPPGPGPIVVSKIVIYVYAYTIAGNVQPTVSANVNGTATACSINATWGTSLAWQRHVAFGLWPISYFASFPAGENSPTTAFAIKIDPGTLGGSGAGVTSIDVRSGYAELHE